MWKNLQVWVKSFIVIYYLGQTKAFYHEIQNLSLILQLFPSCRQHLIVKRPEVLNSEISLQQTIQITILPEYNYTRGFFARLSPESLKYGYGDIRLAAVFDQLTGSSIKSSGCDAFTILADLT